MFTLKNLARKGVNHFQTDVSWAIGWIPQDLIVKIDSGNGLVVRQKAITWIHVDQDLLMPYSAKMS